MNRNKDIKYGEQKENDLIDIFKREFNTNFKKTSKFNEFDYISCPLTAKRCRGGKKIILELKSRRVKKNTYKTTIIGLNKVNKGLELIKEGFEVYFVFCFTDGLFRYKLTELNSGWIDMGGRTDRGKDERKLYYHIPISELINFKKNINPKIYQPPMTTDQRPATYTERLIQYFEEQGNNFSISDVRKIVKDFNDAEYKRRREKTDEMPFGKYKYKKVVEVAKFDKQYLQWIYRQEMLNKYEELKREIEKHIS